MLKSPTDSCTMTMCSITDLELSDGMRVLFPKIRQKK